MLNSALSFKRENRAFEIVSMAKINQFWSLSIIQIGKPIRKSFLALSNNSMEVGENTNLFLAVNYSCLSYSTI